MNILMSISIYVIIVAMKQVGSDTCIGKYCFTMSNSNELGNFDAVKSLCTMKNSALAVFYTSDAQLALTQFLNSSNTSALAFINVKLLDQGFNAWFLVNGSSYNGSIGNQENRNSDYKLYCYLQPYGNLFQVEASKPSELNRYICEFQDTSCLNYSTSRSILYSGRCYVKYQIDALTWYQARERCINSGGDLATFQTQSNSPPFNTSWLNQSMTYWIGIRWNDRRWRTPDKEAIYNPWSSAEPNNYDYQCVCVDPNGNPPWSWTDCSCGDQRQFVCLKIVPTTTTSTTTTTTTRAPTIFTTSEVKAGSNSNSTANALILGLVLGIILPMTIVIIVLIVIVVHQRRQARDKPRSSESASAVPNTASVQQDRSATELNTTTADTNYQHLQKGSTPRMTTQLYEPLSQPEIRDYESVPEMT